MVSLESYVFAFEFLDRSLGLLGKQVRAARANLPQTFEQPTPLI